MHTLEQTINIQIVMSSKFLFVLIIFLSIVSLMNGQQKIIDSLEQQLSKSTNGNTTAENLIQLGYYYTSTDPKKGIVKLDKAIELTLKNKDSFELAMAFQYKALNYKNLGKDSLSFAFYDKAEIVLKAIDSTHTLSRLMFNKGLFYSERSDYQNAIKNVQNALELFTKEKDTLLMGYSIGTLGYYHIFTGDYTTSLDSFLKGLFLLEQIDKKESVFYASVQGNLGILYQRLAEYDTALEYHHKALKFFKKIDLQQLMASQYTEIANIYDQQKKYKKALTNYKAAYEISKRNNNIVSIASNYSNMGLIYSHLENYDNALIYIDSAMVINKALKDYGKLSINHHNKGEVYYHKNNFLSARKNFDSSLFYAKSLDDKRLIYEGNNWLSEIAFIQGDYKTAYTTLREAEVVRDTLFSEEKKEELFTLKTKYNYEKKKAILEADFEKNKAINETQIKQQTLIRNISIGVGIFSISILAIGLTLFRRKKEADLNAKLVTSELQKLKAQMNPHFIFNSLNSINDYISRNKKEEANHYVTRFSMMMRKILNNSKEEEVSLNDEIEFLEMYLKLEQQRLENRFEYTIDVDNDIDKEDTLVPPTLFQPFIENSIWHGLSEKKEKGVLTITFVKEQNILICIIDDNGIGIKPPNNNIINKESHGISSTQSRLDLLNKLKGVDAKINFIDKKEGVRVVIRLPLSLKF